MNGTYRKARDGPDDLGDYMIGSLIDTNRNIATHGELIFHTSMDDHIVALDAETGEVVWDKEILDYTVNPANQTSGPIVANGKVYSGRSCDPRGGPHGCVITAHDAATGEELWRTRLIPGPGEPGDETWGDVPFEERGHVGSWMVPSVDPELNPVYVGTSVTSPAPKFMLGGADLTHLYHNSTLALNGDTGEIVWHYQHMNDHWDLDHPFERLLVDTAVRPNAAAVSWINPRIQPGEERRVLTGIPGKTGIVYTLDRDTAEFLWATPTITQNVVSGIDGATGQVTENAELIFTARGQQVLACPHASGAGTGSPYTDPRRPQWIPYSLDEPANRTRQKTAETGSLHQKRLPVRLAVQAPHRRHSPAPPLKTQKLSRSSPPLAPWHPTAASWPPAGPRLSPPRRVLSLGHVPIGNTLSPAPTTRRAGPVPAPPLTTRRWHSSPPLVLLDSC